MTRSAWQSVLAPGPARPDQSLAAISGTLALSLTLWLLGALAVSVLATLGSGTSWLGRSAASAAQVMAPLMLRNAVAGLLGVAIIAVPAAAANALPNSASNTVSAASRSVSAATPDQDLSPAWIPGQDHPAAPPARTMSTDSVALPTSLVTIGTTLGTTTVLAPATRQAQRAVSTVRSQVSPDPGLLPGWLPDQPAQTTQSTQPGRSVRPAQTAQPVPALDQPAPARRPRAARHRIPIDVGPDEIIVKRGDTLWDIAARHLGTGASYGEIALEWPQWYAANRMVIGSNPDQLRPGERLRAPDHDTALRAAGSRRTAQDGSVR